MGMLRGAQSVISAAIRLQQMQCKQIWQNSSLKSLGEEARNTINQSSLSQVGLYITVEMIVLFCVGYTIIYDMLNNCM